MHEDIAALSFEQALLELEEIVKNQSLGKTKLDEAVQVYERGVKLREHCEKKLAEAKMKVEQIGLSPGGEVKFSKTLEELGEK